MGKVLSSSENNIKPLKYILKSVQLLGFVSQRELKTPQEHCDEEAEAVPAESTTIATEINYIHKKKAKEFLLIVKKSLAFKFRGGFCPGLFFMN